MRKLSTGLSFPDRSSSGDNPPFYLTVEKKASTCHCMDFFPHDRSTKLVSTTVVFLCILRLSGYFASLGSIKARFQCQVSTTRRLPAVRLEFSASASRPFIPTRLELLSESPVWGRSMKQGFRPCGRVYEGH